MYLKSLELFGFKSFPSKITLKFDSGITVIVGPNGCGKSNIFDAIRWALGEQSPRSLRGVKMEDVIFNGTANSLPLNYAEVILVFSNEANYLPIGYKEVAITRRLYRSGESQYFINHNNCRLKDIQDLFAGTGIGETAYSFIEQGTIQTLLSYKPEEKRLIFDEASGIIKYKEKKKETLRKLKDTDDNILRLNDIIAEVRHQSRYLGRQVEKAKKYKELHEALVDIENKLAAVKLKKIANKTAVISGELAKLQDEENDRKIQISAKSKEFQEISNHIDKLRKALEDVNAETISAQSHIENYQNNIKINNQRIEEIRERLSNLEHSLSDACQRVTRQASRIDQEKQGLLSLGDNLVNLEKKLKTLIDTRLLSANQLQQLQKLIVSQKESVLQLEEQKTVINNNLIALNTYLNNLLSRKKRLELDAAKQIGRASCRERV